MSNGPTHAGATLLAGASTGVTMFTLGFPTSEIYAVLLGFGITFFVNPDLDLNTPFPRSDPKRWLWWLFWYPYSRLCPHRSIASHFPVLSTLIRVAYLLIPLMLLSFHVPVWFIWVVAGMIISDTLHYVMDIVSTAIKLKRLLRF